MRKTLLIAAAALAAGVISSQAQVYSQNIVGYVNTPLPSGYNLIENPLTTGVSNGVNEVFANINDGDVFVFWNGAGYNQVEYSPFWQSIYGFPTPWWDPVNTVSAAIPTIVPGEAFFYYNSGSSNTVTLVGTVIQASTNGLTAGYNMVGAILPVGGSVTNAAWNLTPADGDIYVTWTGAGYNQVEYSPFWQSIYGFPTPWWDPVNTVSAAPPVITVGQGFFYYNSASTNIWVQSIP
jgi:hypothetical protein